MIHPTRVQPLTPAQSAGGHFVLLWVQASVRCRDNHALEYAVRVANERGLPVLAVFGLTPDYPGANARHFRYLLEGLRDLRAGLAERGIPFSVRLGSPPEVALAAAKGANLVVTDVAYLRHHRAWRAWLAERLPALVQVESEALVPVGVASPKQEWAARTLRPKVHRLWPDYLVPLTPHELRRPLKTDNLQDCGLRDWDPGLDLLDPAALTASLPVDPSVPPGAEEGGERAALAQLKSFVAEGLAAYAERRSDPNVDGASRLSAALHYGHLSPLTAALAAREAAEAGDGQAGEGLAAFLEELLVRRELSFNYTTYCAAYDRYEGLPDWAQRTLAAHVADPRPALYTREELDAARTEDPYWNAAQRQMVQTGRMHNALRMYWGKKVLEWTADPREAYDTLIWLNDRYEQDGRDSNSYANIGWVLGLHDRPWARRPVFGTVRYMNATGLRRKFDADAYARRWNGESG